MSKIKKTILHVEVDEHDFHIQYTGSIQRKDDQTAFKHDERLIRMLLANDDIFDLFWRVTSPVMRYKRRKERKEVCDHQ